MYISCLLVAVQTLEKARANGAFVKPQQASHNVASIEEPAQSGLTSYQPFCKSDTYMVIVQIDSSNEPTAKRTKPTSEN